MQVVARTDEYTIYKKRNQRYAVRRKNREWVRGNDKVAVLLAHNLIEAAVPKAPEHPQEPPVETGAEAAGEASEDAGRADAEAPSSDADTADPDKS